VSERELRVYMGGLKCTPHHVDRMVKVFRQCTVILPKEPPANPVPTHSAILDPGPDRLSSVEDDLTLLKKKTEDYPRTASHDEEERKRWPQEDAPIHLVDASQPQPSPRRGQRYRTAIAAATALTVTALTALGAEFFVGQRQSATLPPPSGISTPSLSPPGVPLILESPSDFDNVTPSGHPPLVRIAKRPTQTSELQHPPGSSDFASRDTTEHTGRLCCVRKEQDRPVRVAVPHVEPDWSSRMGATGEWEPGFDDEQPQEDTK
ncbi:MAG: hypothetical protein ACREP9_22545, partial [Candidatus Dormibacteraceae bacterium]